MATTVNFAVLQPGLSLTASPVIGVTGVAGSQTVIKRAVFTNITTVVATITAWRVPNSGTPVGTNAIIPTRNVAANGTDLAPELAGMVLDGGDTIQVQTGTAASINFFASGVVAS